MNEIPMRAPDAVAIDDTVMPFQVDALDLRGRLVRLGPMVDEILGGHDYPAPVSKLLGEAIVLGTLLGTALKAEGRFILQTQTDGPVSMLIVDFRAPGDVRACASFDKDRVEEFLAAGRKDASTLLGRGHMAMTIDQGAAASRYQGLVELNGDLEAAAHEYFLRSEQIPTRVRLAVAEDFRPEGERMRRRWRAGGVLAQFLPKSEIRSRQPDLHPGDAPAGTEPHVVPADDRWTEAQALIETIEPIELIDPALSHERLLYRLFNERGVRAFAGQAVRARCSCSQERIAEMLSRFSQDDRDHMVENGKISVTCEFCNSHYVVDPAELPPAEKN